MSNAYVDILTKDLLAVGESHVQIDDFAFSTLPKVMVDDVIGDRIKTTNYKLPAFNNSLKTNNVIRWEIGQEDVPQASLASVDAAITPLGYSTYKLPRPLAAGNQTSAQFRQTRFADLNNILRLLMSEAKQQLEDELVSALRNTTYWGALKTFSGTGALDQYSNDHIPLTDIENELEALRVYQRFTNFELRCYTTSKVLRVLSKQNEYTGWAQMGGGPKQITTPLMIQYLKEVHGIDNVILVDSVNNDVMAGQTTSIEYTAPNGELLFFGLFDKRSSFNLQGDPGFFAEGPDGALGWGVARDLSPKSNINEWREVEDFVVRWSSVIYSPRGNSSPLGISFTDIIT